ncbi:MAG: lysophospholipid acyltransferase family protein [Syntrophotaleaceae bacterium]
MTENQNPADIFRLSCPKNAPLPKRLLAAVVGPAFESLLGLKQCRRLYEKLPGGESSVDFSANALVELGVTCRVEEAEMARIPRQGPVVVVANHPFGAVEGLMLLALLRRVRPDVKVMANYLLSRIPQLQELVIAVDPFGGTGAARRNLAPLRESLQWLERGGLLLIFPAGEVSHYQPSHRAIADPPWSRTLARIVRRSGAPVLPVFLPGRNSLFFQCAGLIHPRLRTALLARELLNKQGRKLSVQVGVLLPSKQLSRFASDQELTDYLRLRTYMLGCAPRPPREDPGKSGPAEGSADDPARLIATQDPDLLADELSRLPNAQKLAENGDLQVWQAEAVQIPYLLLEIGRLREETFRAVGEGTGRPFDLDRFDRHYLHIFLWHQERREVVGAYRIGRCDRILATQGKAGLYTSTLFKYRSKLFERLGPALELGRSFIRCEYQRSYAPLLLLWKGIGRFVVANPQYRILFGPVSISRDYSDMSRQLIAGSLRHSLQLPQLARLVKPRVPLAIKKVRVKGCKTGLAQTFCSNIEEVSALIADIEIEQKGIPVLLRHYLNLGGNLLAFNVDREFSDVLDGLILVDLTKTEIRTLERYFGKTGAQAFLNYQNLAGIQSEALCA